MEACIYKAESVSSRDRKETPSRRENWLTSRRENLVSRSLRPDVGYSISVTSRYQQNPGEAHWVAVKNILKYQRRTKDLFLVFGDSEDEISVTGYTDASF
ncbi:hypothetical protein OSB04_031853 [Centaurea solstitialis]|uniref:Uncharacterized protein n=1 Tax=Centaurea solstitialis TaxID=347529 RepID=A0AA38W550_9ASTR|nr:hypothetical protein OSB04_031853 [Centaurea solstitialis]